MHYICLYLLASFLWSTAQDGALTSQLIIIALGGVLRCTLRTRVVLLIQVLLLLARCPICAPLFGSLSPLPTPKDSIPSLQTFLICANPCYKFRFFS